MLKVIRISKLITKITSGMSSKNSIIISIVRTKFTKNRVRLCQPEYPISCNLLIKIVICGMIKTNHNTNAKTLTIKYKNNTNRLLKESSTSEIIKIVSRKNDRRLRGSCIRNMKRRIQLYSDLDALPRKSAQFLKKLLIASLKEIISFGLSEPDISLLFRDSNEELV